MKVKRFNRIYAVVGVCLTSTFLFFTVGCSNGSTGGKPADKGETPIGKKTLTELGVDVHQMAGVTNAQFNTAFDNIQAGYEGLDEKAKKDLDGKISRINVIADKDYTWNETTKVLGLTYNATVENVSSVFTGIINGYLPEEN